MTDNESKLIQRLFRYRNRVEMDGLRWEREEINLTAKLFFSTDKDEQPYLRRRLNEVRSQRRRCEELARAAFITLARLKERAGKLLLGSHSDKFKYGRSGRFKPEGITA